MRTICAVVGGARVGKSWALKMPPKVSELIARLEQAGFQNRGGKGSHRNFVHPNVTKTDNRLW